MSKINVENLTKDYGKGKGIFDLNFTIEKGEVFGYIGPNGAGKTTTIRHLLGFLKPDKGVCTIGNLHCKKDSAKIHEDLGYLPGEISLLEDMTGIEFLKFMGHLRRLKDFSYMNELIGFFELNAKEKIKKMSKGMKQKLAIICAFMHNPSTLILDEPTSGLDPLMQNKFIDLILKEKALGKTIFMSSHNFEEVERTCDKVAIIKEGRFVTVKETSTLKENQRKIYRVSFKEKEEAHKFTKENFEIISQTDHVVKIAISGCPQNFINALSHYQILDLDIISQSLEEIFMTYYGGENND